VVDLLRDPSLLRVLGELKIDPEALLGHGGEACVFAYGHEQIARIHHAGEDGAAIEARALLLSELRPHHERLSFAIPHVCELRRVAGRFVTIEPRLRGQTLARALREVQGTRRAELLSSTLEASRALGQLPFTRQWFGDLCRVPPIRVPSWQEYLRRRARASLAAAGDVFASVDVEALCRPFEEPARPGFVHLDLYVGNVLVDASGVTALLDFGGVPVFGDPDFDPLSVAVYLRGEMTDDAHESDHAVCREWLERAGLAERLDAAERWIAAMWSFAVDDAKVQSWCRRVLLAR
jgi:aminoglycoside phosphotransferase (APT) family kinase protein